MNSPESLEMPVLNKYGGEVEIEEVSGVDQLVFRCGSSKWLISRKQCYGWGSILIISGIILSIIGGAFMNKEINDEDSDVNYAGSIALIIIGMVGFSSGISILVLYRCRRTKGLTAVINSVGSGLAMENRREEAISNVQLNQSIYVSDTAYGNALSAAQNANYRWSVFQAIVRQHYDWL